MKLFHGGYAVRGLDQLRRYDLLRFLFPRADRALKAGDEKYAAFVDKALANTDRRIAEGKPVLGICLGSQLLAHVLGADVRPAPKKEIGWGDVHLTDAAAGDALCHGVDEPFTALHWHGDVFTLPDGAVSLARSAQTEHQAFRYGDTAYGLLFHLEVTPKTVAWMTKAFRDELAREEIDGAAVRRAAMTHEMALRDTAHAVFGRWAELVRE